MGKTLKRLRRRLTDPIVGLMLYSAIFVASFFSLARLGRIADFVTPLLVAISPGGRKLVMANLRVAFPDWTDEERRRICRNCFGHMFLSFLEFLWFCRHPERLMRYVDPEGGDTPAITAAARDTGRGTVMITPHLGNFEFAGQTIASLGGNFHAVAHEFRNPWLQKVAMYGREYHGMRIILEHGAMRKIVKALKTGDSVAFLIDQNTRPQDGGIFVNFFGLPVTVSRAPASMARRLDCDVLIGSIARENGTFILVGEHLPKPVSEYNSDLELTQAIMEANERLIRRYPDSYAWTYERWRYIPENTPPEARERYPDYARPYVPPARKRQPQEDATA